MLSFMCLTKSLYVCMYIFSVVILQSFEYFLWKLTIFM
jgi:hypothetical protein